MRIEKKVKVRIYARDFGSLSTLSVKASVLAVLFQGVVDVCFHWGRLWRAVCVVLEDNGGDEAFRHCSRLLLYCFYFFDSLTEFR
jgi:hypothetical protein